MAMNYEIIKKQVIQKGTVSESDAQRLKFYENKYGTLPDGITMYEIGTLALIQRAKYDLLRGILNSLNERL